MEVLRFCVVVDEFKVMLADYVFKMRNSKGMVKINTF